jgi:hypothetical protein
LGVALINAGLRCTLAFPCPAEMHGSMHIHGQKASRLDMVFICRRRRMGMAAYSPDLIRAKKRYETTVRAMGGARQICEIAVMTPPGVRPNSPRSPQSGH